MGKEMRMRLTLKIGLSWLLYHMIRKERSKTRGTTSEEPAIAHTMRRCADKALHAGMHDGPSFIEFGHHEKMSRTQMCELSAIYWSAT